MHFSPKIILKMFWSKKRIGVQNSLEKKIMIIKYLIKIFGGLIEFEERENMDSWSELTRDYLTCFNLKYNDGPGFTVVD